MNTSKEGHSHQSELCNLRLCLCAARQRSSGLVCWLPCCRATACILCPKPFLRFTLSRAALRPSPSSLSFHPAHIQFLHNASVSLKSDSADPPSGGMLLRAHARFAIRISIHIFAVIENCDQKRPDASTSVCLAAISSGFGT